VVGSNFADAIYAWYRYSRIKRNALTAGLAVLTCIVAIGTALSTLFVKQHYIADEIAGIALGWGIGKFVYDRLEVRVPSAKAA
jgi:membrane-associated phospholipid phosphatase